LHIFALVIISEGTMFHPNTVAASRHSTRSATAYCDRNGRITIGRRCPANMAAMAHGSESTLRRAITACGRLAYDGKTWLVPGVPEAESDQEAVEAVTRFAAFLTKRRPAIRCALKIRAAGGAS
jgi:hypothetical protein